MDHKCMEMENVIDMLFTSMHISTREHNGEVWWEIVTDQHDRYDIIYCPFCGVKLE